MDEATPPASQPTPVSRGLSRRWFLAGAAGLVAGGAAGAMVELVSDDGPSEPPPATSSQVWWRPSAGENMHLLAGEHAPAHARHVPSPGLLHVLYVRSAGSYMQVASGTHGPPKVLAVHFW